MSHRSVIQPKYKVELVCNSRHWGQTRTWLLPAHLCVDDLALETFCQEAL